MREDIKRVFDGIELSSEAKDTIFNRCIEKKHVRNVRIRYAGQIAAAAIAAGVLVFGSRYCLCCCQPVSGVYG